MIEIKWTPKNPGQAVQVLSLDAFEKAHPELLQKTRLFGNGRPIRFNVITMRQGELSGTFVIPKKEQPILDQMTFGFVLDEGTLYFVEDRGDLQGLLQKFMENSDRVETSPFQFLIQFMNDLIVEDIYFLENYNARLEDIEENIYSGHSAGMERFIMMARRDMNTLANYYLQLSAVGEMMQQTIVPQNSNDENAMVSLFLSRCSQLLGLVGDIKDYTSQIWNLRQTQLSDRQNKISTLLTVITTLFLPVTFVTGWYGMNFKDMPLTQYRYGYPIIICVVLIVVFLEVRFIKARHWLSNDVTGGSERQKGKNSFPKSERKVFRHDDTKESLH